MYKFYFPLLIDTYFYLVAVFRFFSFTKPKSNLMFLLIELEKMKSLTTSLSRKKEGKIKAGVKMKL